MTMFLWEGVVDPCDRDGAVAVAVVVPIVAFWRNQGAEMIDNLLGRWGVRVRDCSDDSGWVLVLRGSACVNQRE